uniref:Uncharacterized protein n=1 Tax=Pelusios castaneus TaxID=367368 RepID=A0A8C8STS7_9SAUR
IASSVLSGLPTPPPAVVRESRIYKDSELKDLAATHKQTPSETVGDCGAELRRLGPFPSHPAVAEGWRSRVAAGTPATTPTGWEWATQAVRNAWPAPLSWTESPHQCYSGAPLPGSSAKYLPPAHVTPYHIPFTPGIRSRLLALEPPRLRGMMLAVLSGLVGNPISAAAAVLAQAGDVGEESGPPSAKKQAASEHPKPSRHDMFLALLIVKRYRALRHPGVPCKGVTAAPSPHTRGPPAVSPSAPQVPAPPGQCLPSQPQQ